MKTLKNFLPFGRPNISEQEISAVVRVMHSGWIGMGPEVIAFEKELSKSIGAPYVVTVNSCTSALFLSLLVLGVGEGDEVICPSLTWCSTANVALYLGAKPIFCDIDPETLCVTPESVLKKVSPKTKAVIVVHFGGLAVEMDRLRDALPPSVHIVEDAAHALGAKFANGKPVGSSDNLTCFSFYANKNLSTGEGGAIALFDENLAERLRSLRQHGLDSDAWKRFLDPGSLLSGQLKELGYKMNYTDLQACIGRIQLRRQPKFHAIRLSIAKNYLSEAERMGLLCQKSCIDSYHARHLFVVFLPLEQMKLSRDEIVLKLRKSKIGAAIHYSPLHRMPLYKVFNRDTSLPNTEFVSPRIMTLPISASMELDDAKYVITQLKGILS